jgi:hypothetical protein
VIAFAKIYYGQTGKKATKTVRLECLAGCPFRILFAFTEIRITV